MPNVGIVIACIPPVLLALIQHGLIGALVVIVVLFIINLIGDNVITPQLMGSGLDLSQSVVFFTFVFWTWMFGAIGALLSVLLTVLVKLILETNDETRWLAVIMSSNKEKKPEKRNTERDERNDQKTSPS
ncbi:AI-2E family transporter [Ktedonosporobacter rubrisoli]|uniref:AI-2E family transporter n=1 Tax=Ktedonosporobacter rubrisoli TaxID=2509675 RepID=A0A4P6JPU9_KTERU|nr:AI-2E family transporter [Ktedonosporobacter rubrisoli]